MTIKSIPLTAIERDMQLQPRATLHRDWVEEYAEDIVAGAKLPPVIVFRDPDGKHWLGDGFHRLFGTEASGRATIMADVRKGTRRDALLFSCGANAEHGHRRTNDDKRRAVMIMLDDPEWAKWSDHEIARQCAVSQPFVTGQRPSNNNYQIDEPQPRTVNRGGKKYTMKTGNIGRGGGKSKPASEPSKPQDEPFDHEAAKLRSRMIDAVSALAEMPEPQAVIDAWMKSMQYGIPLETFDKAADWLDDFIVLYREAEPKRQDWINRATERTRHAAE